MKRFILFSVIFLFPVFVWGQKTATAGVSSGDTLSSAFSMETNQFPAFLVSPAANATDSLRVLVLDTDGSYTPMFVNNSEYLVIVSASRKSIVPLDPDIWYNVEKFKVDMEDVAGDTITYKCITKRKR